MNLIIIFVYKLNKRSILENVYIQWTTEIAVESKVLVSVGKKNHEHITADKQRSFFFTMFLPMPFVSGSNHSKLTQLRLNFLPLFICCCIGVLGLFVYSCLILDETGVGSSPLKRHSDLTLRKVRRHVLQLSQHWKNANNSVQHRLKVLQCAHTVDKIFDSYFQSIKYFSDSQEITVQI